MLTAIPVVHRFEHRIWLMDREHGTLGEDLQRERDIYFCPRCQPVP